MKKIKFGLITASFLLIGLSSCNTDEILTDVEDQTNYAARDGGETSSFESFFYKEHEIAMKDFSEALIRAMQKSISLRRLIKEEALKKFNNDTDVLVASLVEKEINEGNVGDFINQFLSSKKIDQILMQIPTLTVLVPELPMESFSAEIWNVETQLPAVAIRTVLSNDNPFFEFLEDGTLATDVIPADLIPADPILVTKVNERVTTSLNEDFSRATGRRFFTSNVIGVDYVFIADAFDGLLNPYSIIPRPSNVDQQIADAYHLTNSQSSWQRDYIYYDIHPAKQNGPYNYKFKEYVKFIKPREYNGSAKGAYVKMSQQITGDPAYQTASGDNNFNSWTDGAFEIVLDFKINSASGTGGEIINHSITALPSQIFELELKHTVKGTLFWKKNYFEVIGIKAKAHYVDLPIINWDLREYATKMKVHMFEYDKDTYLEESETVKATAATNFGIDASSIPMGEEAKLGIKFGASATRETSHTYTVKTTYSSNEMANIEIHFNEPVITGYINGSSNFKINHYFMATQKSSDIEFCMMPKRIAN